MPSKSGTSSNSSSSENRAAWKKINMKEAPITQNTAEPAPAIQNIGKDRIARIAY